MKDVLLGILKFVPSYLGVLLSVVRNPAHELLASDGRVLPDVKNALAFLAMSVAIGEILQAPTLDKDGFLPVLAAQLFQTLVFLVLFSVALTVVWSAVGGKGSLEGHLVTYSYFTGAVLVLGRLIYLVSVGMMRTWAGDHYKKILAGDSGPFKTATGTEMLVTSLSVVVFLAGLLALTVWCVRFWTLFRILNRSNRARSAVAFVLCFFIGIPVIFVARMISNAVF